MGKLFDNFFKDGEEMKGEFGEYKGRIDSHDENTSFLYDEWGNYKGRIESYGNDVVVYDDFNNVVESGVYHGGDDLDTLRYDGVGKTYFDGINTSRLESDLDFHKEEDEEDEY